MENYKSNKQISADAKKRSGTYPVNNIKSVDHLPTPFKTDLNKKWLDATFDQMISKGDLENIDAFIGDSSGHALLQQDDSYLNTGNNAPQLEPAIVTYDTAGEIKNAIAIDDIANSIAMNFDEYNYNAAYNSNAYVFAPPINIDKFVNFVSYYWASDLPVYESTYTAGGDTNPIFSLTGTPTGSFEDANNTVELHEGMKIKFSGGYDIDIEGNTYLVTGVGDYIHFKLMVDSSGRQFYTDTTPYSNTSGGLWDDNVINTAIYNSETLTDPFDLIDAYNAATTRPPLFKFLISEVNKEVYLTNDMIVSFNDSWTWTEVDGELNEHRVFIVNVDNVTGDVSLDTVIDAQYNGPIIETFVVPGYEELATDLGYPFGGSLDSTKIPHSIKDYIVVNRADNIASAWSRGNFWTHKDSIVYMADLMPEIDLKEIITIENRAKRPIIEFDTLIHMMNHGWSTHETNDNAFKGQVDFILGDADKPDLDHEYSGVLPIPVGSYVVYKLTTDQEDYLEIYELQSNGILDPVALLDEGNTFVPYNDLASGDESYAKCDMYIEDGEILLAQCKTLPNTQPLFKLRDKDGMSLSDYDQSTFEGNKIFGYKEGTGRIDPELGFALTYKDVGSGANIVFENSLFETDYYYHRDLGHAPNPIHGYYFFIKGDDNVSTYIPSSYSLGAKDRVQVLLNGDVDDVTIDIGYDNWRVDKEFIIYERDGNITASEVLSEGVYNRMRTNQPDLVLGKDTTYTFHDLTLAQDVKFYDIGTGLDIETIVGHPVVITRSGVDISVTLPDSSGYVLEYGTADIKNRGRIVTSQSFDELFHDVFIDGEKIPFDNYTVTANTIVIPSDILNSDNKIIDVEYYYNDKTTPVNVQVQDVHSHNSNNEKIQTFTIAETLSHWLSLISSTPEFSGDAFGDNTYHKNIQLKTYGGEIFIKDDTSLMHDICYSNDEMNVSAALNEQGRDWWAFKQRVISQTRRLYKTKNYTSVRDLVVDVINSVLMYKTDSGLYNDSNMIFADSNQYVDIDYHVGISTYHLNVDINNDDFKKDHLYLYVTDNRDGDNVAVTRLLMLGEDYILNGSWIELTAGLNTFTDAQQVSMRAYYYQMDTVCNIPQSMTKLGLSHTYMPQVKGNELIGHDGSVYTVTNDVELQRFDDVNFDPVAAVLFDIETRVYNGLRKQDSHGVNSFVKYLPTQHRGTWYTLNKINNHVEKYFKEWYRQSEYTSMTPEGYYDELDPFTWNYSTIQLSEGHLESHLPGHYKGAYTVLFGTTTPDITPWHMIGYTDKPLWWDDHYSWTDSLKRSAMINAFNYGIISEPGQSVIQDLYYARYYWDFDTKSPVDIAGELVSPDIVLGTPSVVDRAQEFIFCDWGPVEWEWRNSSLGQAAMLDAVVKLNPTKAWTDFFQTNVFSDKDNAVGMMLDRYSSKLINTGRLYYDDRNYNNNVHSIEVVSSDLGFPSDTQIRISGDVRTTPATAVLDFDADNEIIGVTLTSRGLNYTTTPTIELWSPSVSVLPNATFNVLVGNCVGSPQGINVAQTNYTIRNQLANTNTNTYAKVDTRLLQKIGGFTGDHLFKIETESGVNGKYVINHGDAPLIMYTSKPNDVHVACEIRITKNSASYTIDGLSNHKQQFKFHEPLANNVNDHVNIDLNMNSTIKKFNKFSDEISIIEYDARLSRVQDVYNFIRGNYQYLNNVGYQFNTLGDARALAFAQWAVTADQGDVFVIELPSVIAFETDQVVLEYNTLPGNINSVIDSTGYTIDNSILSVTRDAQTVAVETKDDSVIASIGTASVAYEHAILFENVTQFNEIIFDDVTNIRQNRLKIIGQRTRNWTGAKQAPGYLIKDNTIIQNFDSVVEEIANFYDFDVDKFNDQVTKAENLMMNNVARDWVSRLNLPASVVSKFFKGVIKSKGTKNVIQRVGRNKLINDGQSLININEEYMFKQGHFGDTTRTKSTEIMITSDQVDTDPSIIDFSDSDIVFVNNVNTPVFGTSLYADNDTLLTAGDVLIDEADNVIFTVDELETLFDNTSSYATIETWNSMDSYKFGDQVRREGKLWSCNVDYIGHATAASDLVFLGSITNPTFTHRNSIDHPSTPSAVIDGTSIWFDKTETVYDSIIVNTTVNPTVQSPSNLIVDGTTIDLVQQELATIVDTNAEHNGNPFALTASNPSSLDVTGLELLINGTTVNLETYATYNPTLMTYEMTRAQLMAAISSVSNVTAYDYEGDVTKVAIVYDVAGDPNLSLVIGTASGNAEFGITAGTYNPTTTQVLQHQLMDIDYVANAIDVVLGTDYSISVVSQVMYIEKLPTTEFTQFTTLEIAGLAQAQLGLPSSTGVSSNVVNINSSAQDAVDYINGASIPGVTASLVSGRVSIESTNAQIDLGDNEFNTEAGIETGVHYSVNEEVGNVFDENDWSNITTEDPALFNIWVADDSELENPTTGAITSKFFNWNVLQSQQFGYYATSIVAGTETDDGNDAQVTLNVARNVEVGDYVMLVNTTTTPNIDGIHKVTRLGNVAQPNTFYINKYIQEDGDSSAVFVLRAARFNRELDLLASLTDTIHYNWNVGDLAWTTEKSGVKGTYVYKYNTTFDELVNRTKTERVTNDKIESVIIYNGDTQSTMVELEVFDPLRGIIPGVTDKELDIKSAVDFAVYNQTTDIHHDTDEHNAWGEYEVGRTWWDMSKVKYYDYEQSDQQYRAKMWGRQFPTSSIDVYEWTKSTVTPEEWKDAVAAGTEIYGTIASGDAYSVYDEALNEDLYYYVEHDEWNDTLEKYDVVYYYWVKNKTTSSENRALSVKAIADIINDPTTQGIAWCAAIDANAMIVNNIKYTVNDINSVLQVTMKPSGAAHNNWMAIREGVDLIPEYWYIGMRDNLTEVQKSTGLRLPNMNLHEYNRYGDDRALEFNGKTYSQSWFKNPWNARRETIIAINNMLRNMNLIQDLDGKWDRTLSQSIVVDTEYDGVDEIETTIPYKLDMTSVWEYSDYISISRSRNALTQPSIDVSSYDELNAIDPSEHSLVRVVIEGSITKLDKSEIFEYDDSLLEWNLVEKKNGTIQFNDFVYNKNLFNGWDGDNGWDGYWDTNPADYMEYIIYACRHDLFIEEHTDNFNKLFFAVVKYAASEHEQLDWMYKTTYVHMNIDTVIRTGSDQARKYTRSAASEINGYINTVKPFHTKIKSVVDTFRMRENLEVVLQESNQKKIKIKTDALLDHTKYVPNTTVLNTSFNTSVTNVISGGSFNSIPSDSVVSLDFLSPSNWNNDHEEYRRTNINPSFNESLSVKVITNTSGNVVDNDTRTYAYIQDNNLNTTAFSLQENSAGTTELIVEYDDTSVKLVLGDGASFNPLGGYAYIDGEVIEYRQVVNDTLINITRAQFGTIPTPHDIGSTVINLSDAQLDIFKTLKTINSNNQYGTGQRFDVFSGKSILDVTAEDIESHELQSSGKGIS